MISLPRRCDRRRECLYRPPVWRVRFLVDLNEWNEVGYQTVDGKIEKVNYKVDGFEHGA
jgi:hypothetical protein